MMTNHVHILLSADEPANISKLSQGVGRKQVKGYCQCQSFDGSLPPVITWNVDKTSVVSWYRQLPYDVGFNGRLGVNTSIVTLKLQPNMDFSRQADVLVWEVTGAFPGSMPKF